MALIRSKLRFLFPKSVIKSLSSSFSTIPAITQNPNFSENDEETHETTPNSSSRISPEENPVGKNIRLSSEDHITKNPNFNQNPNLSKDDEETNETDGSLSSNLSFEEIPVVESLYLLIKDHYKKNPNLLHSSNLAISSLSLSFSQVTSVESISPSVFSSVIVKCRSVMRGIPLPQALAFFNWVVGEVDNVECFKPGFVEMVDLAGKAREFDVAWGLIDDMKSRKLEIPSDAFVCLIQRYVRAFMVPEALHTFNRMEEYGCNPDHGTFTAVINILAKKKKAFEAQSFFDGLKDKFEPDLVIYTSLVNGWCRVGEISEAERVFGEMKVKGISPNVYTYSILLDGLCRHGQITRAHDVFAEMLGKGIRPNAVTFNNLMRVHVKSRKTEKVLQVFNQMKRLGCQPDVISYNFLIECHCKDGNRDNAMKLINQMVNKGISPNVHSFNPIFSIISQARDVNAAHKLFAKMKEMKCVPNTVTYNVLMKMFVESKSTDMVFKLKKEMYEFEVEPNLNTYKILITMFCGMGHWANASKYFREMIEEKNLRPNKNLYEMVLKQLRVAGQIKKHEELVEMMVDRGLASRPI